MKVHSGNEGGSQTRLRGTRGKIRRYSVYMVTVLALVGLTAGFVLATGASVVTVYSTQNIYQSQQVSTTDFPNSPTLAVSQSGNPIAASTSVIGSSGGGSTLILAMSANSLNSFGATDFDEMFTFTSITTVGSSATNTFTVTTTYGSPATTTQDTLTYSSTVTHTGADTVKIFIDYGLVVPTGGIVTLQVVVTGS